ncbi:MAG: hypothetical protein ACRDO1_02060 [Nocardioidaceae bacterium]
MSEILDVEALLPGDPEAAGQLAAHLQRSAELLRSASDRITLLGSPGSVWEGPVAQSFLDHLSDLSARVSAIEGDLTTAATQLGQWRDGVLDRQARAASLRDELTAAGAAASTDPGDQHAVSEVERLQTQVHHLHEEHLAEADTVAHGLRRVSESVADPTGSMDGTAWLIHAETLLQQLDDQIGSWVSSEGGAMSDAVGAIGQSTALGATVSQAAGAFTPGLDVALGAAVVAVAAAAPGSHRLVAAARRAASPIPLAALPEATFARPSAAPAATTK